MPPVEATPRHFGCGDIADKLRPQQLRKCPVGGEPPLGVLHPVEQFSQPVVHAVPGGQCEHHRVQPLFPRPGQQRIQLAATLPDTVPEQHGHAQTDPQVCKPEKRARPSCVLLMTSTP